MVTFESAANAAGDGPVADAVSDPSPELERPTKPSKAMANRNIADNDVAAATIQHSFQEEVSNIQQALNLVQSMTQIITSLNEKYEQIKEMAKQASDTKEQVSILQEKIDAIDSLLEEIKRDIEAIEEYSGFLFGMEGNIESRTTLMQFKFQDVLSVE